MSTVVHPDVGPDSRTRGPAPAPLSISDLVPGGSTMRRCLLSAAVVAALTGALLAPATSPAAAATPLRILFDNTKAETAGNADWIIGTSQPDPTGQKVAPVAETDWTGAISAWGVALQRTGQ